MDLTTFLSTYSTPILGIVWFAKEVLAFLSKKNELQNQSNENGYKVAVETFRAELRAVRETVEHERDQNKEMGQKIYHLESEIKVLQNKIDQYERVLFANGLGGFVQQSGEVNQKIDQITQEVKKRKKKDALPNIS